MKTAYLIDRDSVGGGMEYIRRQIAAHPGDESRVFFSCRGECAAAKMNSCRSAFRWLTWITSAPHAFI